MAQPRSRTGRAPATASKQAQRQSTSASRSRPAQLVVVVVAVVAVVAAGAIALTMGDGATEQSAGTSAAVELEHVHGLAVDPASDTLIAGSHYGLFRLPADDPPSLVAGRVQDFMGFTVAGPRHYLASGHPGEGQEGPASLGLIESTDGGQTWQPVSLSGEADFHALQAEHGLVYGYNSLTGAFMVSQDKRTWETRAQLPMANFAVSPEDPDVVLATTEQGPALSNDGGRTFPVIPNAPLLVLVSWADDGTIVGVQPDGTVQASVDGGRTWQRRGRLPGAPEAVEAVSGRQVFAAAGGKVLASNDGGRTFDVRYPR